MEIVLRLTLVGHTGPVLGTGGGATPAEIFARLILFAGKSLRMRIGEAKWCTQRKGAPVEHPARHASQRGLRGKLELSALYVITLRKSLAVGFRCYRAYVINPSRHLQLSPNITQTRFQNERRI